MTLYAYLIITLLKFSISCIFCKSVTKSITDGRTNRPTDTPSYRDARTHLISFWWRLKRSLDQYQANISSSYMLSLDVIPPHESMFSEKVHCWKKFSLTNIWCKQHKPFYPRKVHQQKYRRLESRQRWFCAIESQMSHWMVFDTKLTMKKLLQM